MSGLFKNKKNFIFHFSIEDFNNYKEEFIKIKSIKDENYSNLLKTLETFKIDNIHLLFLLFAQYEKWIFPFISPNIIICNNGYSFCPKIIYNFEKLKQNKNFVFDEKAFILWYFYLFYFLLYKDNNEKEIIINHFKYLLFETNKVASILFENNILLINNAINILDMYLLTLKNYINSSGYFNSSSKIIKIKKMIYFQFFFDFLEKISIILIKEKKYKDLELILGYIKKIIINSEFNDEINIIILVNNNIINNFMNNFLKNLNYIEIEKNLTLYKIELINFYKHFLSYKYKISNLFPKCLDILRKSFEHLYNFKDNKHFIIKDISLNSFNSNLLYELLKENEKNQLDSSFLFEHKNSIISFMHEKILLDKIILFFSFKIGNNQNGLNVNENLPLILIRQNHKNNATEIFLKIYLVKIKEDKNSIKYKLLFSQNRNNSNNILKSKIDDNFIIDKNDTYYFAIYFNDKKIKAYLYHDILKKNSNIIFKEFGFQPMKKEGNCHFMIGNDKENSFYNGKIGPIIMIKSKDFKEKEIEPFIQSVLLLKNKYKDFLITKSDLSKNYDFNLMDYYEQKELIDNNVTLSKNKEKKNQNFDCLLYLDPKSINFCYNNIINEKNEDCEIIKHLPNISGFCNKNTEYSLLRVNISIINNENINKLFSMDNGLSYICLQIEYYNQFAQYYLLKSSNNEIYSKQELEVIKKELVSNLKSNILIIGFQNKSKYFNNYYKNIFINLYNCLLNLNKITPIINDIFDDLLILKDIYRECIINFRNNYIDENESIVEDFINIQNRFESKINTDNTNQIKTFFHSNNSYYIGIIEILLSIDFYKYSQKELIYKLFNNLLQHNIKLIIIDKSEDSYINNFYENIFYKLLNFILLIDKYFNQKENSNNIILNDKEKEKEKENINLLNLNFKLIFSILNEKSEMDNNESFDKLFRFVFKNNIDNLYIIYSYLEALYNNSINKYIFIFKENEIILLEHFLFELCNNNNVNHDLKEKIEILLIKLLCDYIFSNPKKIISINYSFIGDYLKINDISKNLLKLIENILGKYLLNTIIKNSNNNFIINDLNEKESVEYIWSLFDFLIIILKSLKCNDKDLKNNLYILINIFSYIEKQIEESLNSNNLDRNIIIYLINFVKFLYLAIKDEELQFLFNDKFFLKLIEGSFNNCFKSTLFHSNIYILIKEQNNQEIKKLISQIFFELKTTQLEKIYLQNINEKNNEVVSDDDINFITTLSKSIENTIIQDINHSDFNIKKTSSNYDSKYTILFLSDFLKLLSLDKKLCKKYEKNSIIFQTITLYKEMKEILLNIDKNTKESNKTFDFFLTSYYFYEIHKFMKKIDLYLKNNKISKHGKLSQELQSLLNQLFALKIILLEDHLKLNQINKDYYLKKIHNDDLILRNVSKIIQNNIFNKKNKGKDLLEIENEMEKELSNIEENKKRKSGELNSQMLDSISKEVIKTSPKRTSYNGNENEEEKNINIIDKESPDKEREINLNVIGQNEKGNNYLIINYTGTMTTNDISPNNIILNDIALENETMEDNQKDDKNDEKKEEKKDEEKNEKKDEKKDEKEKEEKKEEEIPLLEFASNLYPKNIFEEIDKNFIINPKKKFMKIIFGVYFDDFFFNNKTFEQLKIYYLNFYKDTNPESKLLNFPSKLKNFTNGLEPPLFLKENDKFFISKIFPISHNYFYNYMLNNNIKNESIILLKNNIDISSIDKTNNKEEINEFDCELIKIDKIYYGNIINSTKREFFIFKEKKFKLEDDENQSKDDLKNELEKKVFSMSALDIVYTNNAKYAKENAKNSLLDKDIFPEEEIKYNKTVIIFYSDIEEIIERRVLFLWQGIEIFLKNGKSYFFNMITYENYNNLIKNLKKIKDVIFRERAFFSKTPKIGDKWRLQKINTYDYLLLINKYGSRSLNDSNQYYIFPWVLTKFTNLIEINEKEDDIFKYCLKNKEENNDLDNKEDEQISDNKENEDKNDNISKYYNEFRKLKYPVSVQISANKEKKLLKYNDIDENFKHHHGTHYSTSSYIYYFMMRLEPFTTLLIELQNYSQENPDRMMQDLKDTIKIINTGNDNRELIPELFSKVDYFVNVNCAYYGLKKNNKIVDDLNPMFEIYSDKYYNILSIYVRFIIEHRKLLNSKTIAYNISNWIDNVFGVGQLPPIKKRELCFNIFGKNCYEENIDLHDKLNRLFEKDYNNKKLKKKIANRINLIISFGQTPQKIFSEKHKGRNLIASEKNKDLDIENPDNYGHQNDYLGDDFILEYIYNDMKKEDNVYSIKKSGFFFEINALIGKVFILNESSEISIYNTNYYNITDPQNYIFKEFGIFNLPYICFFDKLKINSNYYYLYNIKYAFSSFPIDINSSNSKIPYLYSNKYLMNLMNKIEEIEVESFKFITCRHLDNSFKIHCSSINKKNQLETYSFICEDFVMSCRVISSYSFIIGLKNGKLIKALIYEYKPQKNKKKKEKENKENAKYKITIDKYIQGHKGSINMIEINEKIGVIITAGDDNKIYIRKLYDFELLTSIYLKSKYIVTLAKISPMNFLYVMCYNKIKRKFVIFGYTLSGLKFAKSFYSYFTNFDFTKIGNIICLINQKEIEILAAHNLNKIKINASDADYKKFENVKKSILNSIWMQYDDFENNKGENRKVISYLSIDPNSNEYNFNNLKATNISYFE